MRHLGVFEGHHASRCRGFSIQSTPPRDCAGLIAMALFLATVVALCLEFG